MNDAPQLDGNGDFKFNEYCYEHGTKFIIGVCGKKICIDCLKEHEFYKNSCYSCKFYNNVSDYDVNYFIEECEFFYDNLKNWPFKNGCKRKVLR